MKIDLELYQQIRYLKNIEGMSQRAIAKKLDISRTTVSKYCDGSQVPWERKPYMKRPTTVITQEITDFINQCFEEDNDHGHKKQKHTAHRIYTRLVDEYKFSGSESTIRRVVRQLRDPLNDSHVPLEFDPAEAAQIDFGTAYIYLNGKQTKIKLFCMRQCFSCAIYIQAFLAENEECFLEGHIGAFEFFGGVPKRLIFDNAKVAVKEGLGAYVTKETQRYKELQAHYAFTTDYCNPRKGNEKGLVENLVGFGRRNFLVPMPRVSSLDEVNSLLLEQCKKYMNHCIQGSTLSVGDNFFLDQKALTTLPVYAYNPQKVFYTSPNSYGLITHATNKYSVPTSLSGKEVLIKVSANKVNVYYKGESVAQHDRCYTKNQKIYDIRHYISLLEAKKRAVFNAAPVRQYVPKEVLSEYSRMPNGRNLLLNYIKDSLNMPVIEDIPVVASSLHEYDYLIQEVTH